MTPYASLAQTWAGLTDDERRRLRKQALRKAESTACDCPNGCRERVAREWLSLAVRRRQQRESPWLRALAGAERSAG